MTRSAQLGFEAQWNGKPMYAVSSRFVLGVSEWAEFSFCHGIGHRERMATHHPIILMRSWITAIGAQDMLTVDWVIPYPFGQAHSFGHALGRAEVEQ